jgi:hypothetical protein
LIVQEDSLGEASVFSIGQIAFRKSKVILNRNGPSTFMMVGLGRRIWARKVRNYMTFSRKRT